MRSTFFVLFSVLVHAMAIAAIAIAPQRIAEPQGNEIEVQVGEEADQPGVNDATNTEPSEASAKLEEVKPEPKVETPVPVKAPVAKAPVAPKPAPKKIAKQTPKPVAAPVVTEETTPVAEVTEEKALPENMSSEIETTEAIEPQPEAPVEMTPVKETVPAGVVAADSQEEDKATEAAVEQAKEEPVGRGNDPKEDGELNKGGATQAGAVSYLELKQAQGNKTPFYPISARKEKREGQLELLYRVTREGKVADVKIAKSSGHDDLDQEAVRAISKFKFVPGQEGWARHPVSFALKGQEEALPSRLRSAGQN